MKHPASLPSPTAGLVHLLGRAVRDMRYTQALRLGRALGLIWYHGIGVRRRTVRSALQATFPRWTRLKIGHVASLVMSNVAANVTTLLWATGQRDPSEQLLRISRFDGWEPLSAAQSRGAVVACSHTGNWDLAALAAAARGLRLTVLSRNLTDETMDRLWNRGRRAHGVTILDESAPLSQVMDAAGPGRTLALMMDQRTGRQRGGIPLPFLWRRAWTSTLPAAVALRRGLPLFAAHSLVGADGTLHVLIRPVDLGDDTRDPSARIRSICRVLNGNLESFVLRHPESWLWLHRRWLPEPVSEPP